MKRHELRLPDLGMDREPISAGLWLVACGSHVTEGQPVLEVLAGSALVDLEAPADGVLVEMRVAADEPLRPGQRLGLIESEGHDD